MNELSIFSERFLKLRLSTKLSQSDFAKKIDVTRQSMHRYENAITLPTIETLIKISKTFNVSIDYLLGFTPTNYFDDAAVAITKRRNSETIQNIISSLESLDKSIK